MDQYLRVCEAVAGPRRPMAARARAKLAMIRYEDSRRKQHCQRWIRR